jgi:hypothetical protein
MYKESYKYTGICRNVTLIISSGYQTILTSLILSATCAKIIIRLDRIVESIQTLNYEHRIPGQREKTICLKFIITVIIINRLL